MSQIIKTLIKKELLLNYFKTVGWDKTKYILIDKFSFKKSKLDDQLNIFINFLKPYYYKNKLFYLERNLSYNNFTTIIRQLCKTHNIPFTSKIIYNKSKYIIEYYIYI